MYVMDEKTRLIYQSALDSYLMVKGTDSFQLV